MADRTAAFLAGVDAPRDIPAPIRVRLEHALVVSALAPTEDNLISILDGPRRLPAGMRSRLETTLTREDDADIADAMYGIDAPRPIPDPMAARLEGAVLRRSRRVAARVWQMSGAAAVAVLVLVASFVVTSDGRRPDRPLPGDNKAIPTLSGTETPTINPPPAADPGKPPPGLNPQPKPSTKVLGVKEVRKPAPSEGAGSAAAPQAGTSETALAPPVGLNRTAARSGGDDQEGLLTSVESLIAQLLRAVGLAPQVGDSPDDVLSIRTLQILPAPAPVPAKAQPAAKTRRSQRSSTTRRPRTATSTPAAPSAPAVQLLPQNGANAGGLITVEVSVLGVSLSL